MTESGKISIEPWEAELVPDANGSRVSWVNVVNDMLDSWRVWKLRIAPRELVRMPVHCNSGEQTPDAQDTSGYLLILCGIVWICMLSKHNLYRKVWKLCCPLTPTYPTYWRPSKGYRFPSAIVPAK